MELRCYRFIFPAMRNLKQQFQMESPKNIFGVAFCYIFISLLFFFKYRVIGK